MRNPTPSRREQEVLKELCQGLTAKEIGSKLYISQGTVETHKKNLLMKFEAKNTVQLAVLATKMGIA